MDFSSGSDSYDEYDNDDGSENLSILDNDIVNSENDASDKGAEWRYISDYRSRLDDDDSMIE